MAGIIQRPPLTWKIKSLLSGLRWRIRMYVWLEGFLLAWIWVLGTFFVAIGSDLLPSLLGVDDLPRPVRAIMLGLVAVVLAVILYRWILRRTLVKLADHSMAVVLERRFGGFHDSLVTAVELSERPDHAAQFSDDMLDHTNREAMSHVRSVSFGNVFNLWPLAIYAAVAMLLSLLVGCYAIIDTEGFLLGSSRFYLLSDKPWPRKAKIMVVGVEIQRPATSPDALPTKKLVRFKDKLVAGRHAQIVRVAKGADVTLLVRADVRAEVIPRVCTVQYLTEQPDSGTVNKDDSDRITGGYQNYAFEKKPFQRMLSSVDFSVIGRNPLFFTALGGGPADRGFGLWPVSNRIRDYRIEVVENPTIVETELDCVFPKYMVDQNLSSWLPRTLELTTATQLPRGTQILVRARANKPLKHVYVYDAESGLPLNVELAIDGDAARFQFAVPSLAGNLALDVTLHDVDDVISQSPHRIFITAIEDQAPRIDVVLRGIGTAVTPDVRIPVVGTIDDDYDIEKTWIEVRVSDTDAHPYEFSLGAGGSVAAAVDFRTIRSDDRNGYTLKPKDKLVLAVKASDKFDLDDSEPNVGTGDQYQLEVVTPDRLLAMLEAREAELRMRFEIIIEEVEAMRDSLLRVKTYGAENRSAGVEPEDEPAGDESRRQENAQSLRVYAVQQAQLASSKSAQEVLGVAVAFRDIREELINNRVDTEDHKNRLKNEVADPLDRVGRTMFPELDRLLKELEESLDDGESRRTAVDSAAAQAEDILLELDKVLQKLIKFETYNELIDIVRKLIEQQEQLIDETGKLHKKQAFDDLRN